jgi:hypothetical protein
METIIYTHETAQFRRDQQTQKRDRLERIRRLGHAHLGNLLSRLVTPNSAVSVLAAVALPVIAGAMA